MNRTIITVIGKDRVGIIATVCTYLAEHKITQGTGNGCFSPDAPVTTSQWAVMLCRAYHQHVSGFLSKKECHQYNQTN